MRHPARSTLCLFTIAIAATATVAGCSDGSSAADTAATPAAAAVPLPERVVTGAELAGFTAPPAKVLGLAALASENDVSVAELRRRGVVRLATAEIPGPPEAFAISAAEELATPRQARVEAARLFAANGTSEPGFVATPFAVATIPGAKGARKTGSHDGKDFVAIEIAWAEGTTAHELFVLGRSKDIDQEDVMAAANAVSARGSAE